MLHERRCFIKFLKDLQKEVNTLPEVLREVLCKLPPCIYVVSQNWDVLLLRQTQFIIDNVFYSFTKDKRGSSKKSNSIFSKILKAKLLINSFDYHQTCIIFISFIMQQNQQLYKKSSIRNIDLKLKSIDFQRFIYLKMQYFNFLMKL